MTVSTKRVSTLQRGRRAACWCKDVFSVMEWDLNAIKQWFSWNVSTLWSLIVASLRLSLKTEKRVDKTVNEIRVLCLRRCLEKACLSMYSLLMIQEWQRRCLNGKHRFESFRRSQVMIPRSQGLIPRKVNARFYFLNLGNLDTFILIYIHIVIFMFTCFFVAPRELQKIGKNSNGCHSNWTSAQQVDK